MRILVATDNEYLYHNFKNIISDVIYDQYNFKFAYSYKNSYFCEKYKDDLNFFPVNFVIESENIISNFDLILSLHCKQIFPPIITEKVRCINIHPGFNPFNRGWFPQVFSIINNTPVGVTIHEIDKELDHGPIIYQELVNIESWQTSKQVYENIIKKEIKLLEVHLIDIINGNYIKRPMSEQGNINTISDFKNLCKIDLNEELTMREAINKLRALTFEGYKNAYFIDDNNNKIWISIHLEKK